MAERIQNGVLYYKLFFFGDMIAIYLAQLFATLIRAAYVRPYIDPNPWLTLLGVLLIAFVVVFFGQHYHRIDERSNLKEFIAMLRLTISIAFIGLSVLFIFKWSESYSRIYLSTWFLAANVCIYILRFLNKKIRKKTGRGIRKKDIIVIADHFGEELRQHLGENYVIAAAYVEDGGAIPEGIARLSSPEELVRYATNNVVDEVFIMDLKFTDTMQAFIKTLTDMGIAVNFNIEETFKGLSNLHMNQILNSNYVTMSINTIGEEDVILKRLFDIILSILSLLLSIPIYIVIAPIVMLTDKGTLFFSQKRVGHNGRIFKMYKIRSMYMDAEARKAELMSQNEMQGLMFKIKDDPRITPIGKFIRKTSIDEIPQFWNVLKGEMSVVGTRPPTVDEYEKYEPWHKARLAIKPGITGMWQVSGRSNITDFNEVVKLDREYISNWSLSLDIKILFKTFGAVLKKKGSR